MRTEPMLPIVPSPSPLRPTKTPPATNKASRLGLLLLGLFGLAGALAVALVQPDLPRAVAKRAEAGRPGAIAGDSSAAIIRAARTVPSFTTRPAPRDPAAVPATWDEFQAAIAEAVAFCTAGGACDERQLLLDQSGLGFDHYLGKKHPRRAELLDIVGASYDHRAQLKRQFEAGTLDRTQLFADLTAHVGGVFDRFAQILDDEEWKRMFDIKKGENPSDLFRLTPDHALALDRQFGKTGVGMP